MTNLGGPFELQIDGVWVPLTGVGAGVGVTTERARSSFTSVGGIRHAQRARRGPRTWSVHLPWADSAALRALELACESDDVWLHDTAAARINMLRPDQSQGGPGEAIAMVDGLPVRTIPGSDDAPAIRIRVRPGWIRLSCWTDAVPGTWVLFGDDGGLIAPAGSGWRFIEAPINATGPVMKVWPWERIAALRVTEGLTPPQSQWSPGRGTPCRVVVTDPERSLDILRAGEAIGGVSLTLMEVG